MRRLVSLCLIFASVLGLSGSLGASGAAPKVTFDVLAGFKYEPSAEAGGTGKGSEIPATVKRFDGQKVVVVGFMVPTKLEGTAVKEFLLVRSPMMCCYGVVPQVNEWVLVTMNKAVPYVPDVPRAVEGLLHVGEQYDNGYLTGLYRVEGESFGEDTP